MQCIAQGTTGSGGGKRIASGLVDGDAGGATAGAPAIGTGLHTGMQGERAACTEFQSVGRKKILCGEVHDIYGIAAHPTGIGYRHPVSTGAVYIKAGTRRAIAPLDQAADARGKIKGNRGLVTGDDICAEVDGGQAFGGKLNGVAEAAAGILHLKK